MKPADRETTGQPIAVGAAAIGLVAFGLYLAASLPPYLRYVEHRDLHVWVQSAYNTMSGRWFYASIVDCNQIGVHFSWIMAAFVPVIAVFRSPAALLVLQVAALSAAVAVGLVLADRVAGDRKTAALLTASGLLLNPAILGSAAFGFYAANFQTVFLLGLFLAVESHRERQAWFFFVLALGCKVDVAITLALFGLYRAVVRREIAPGIAMAVVAALYFGAAFAWIMPWLRDGADLADWTSRYAHLGASPGEAVRTILLDPARLARVLAAPRNIVYVLWLLAAAWFLPLRSAFSLVALPAIALNTLSSFDLQTALLGPYDAGIVAVLFYAGCLAVRRRTEKRGAPISRMRLVIALSVAAVFLAISPPFGAVVTGDHGFAFPPLSADRIAAARRIEARIPDGASLAVDAHLAPRVAMRPVIEAPIRDVREIAAGVYDYVWVDLAFLPTQRRDRFLRMAAAHYREVARDHDMLLLENRQLEEPPGDGG